MVRVMASHVNLRAQPRMNADVVGQVEYDARLPARNTEGEWVEVEAPESVDLWVSKSFIQQPQNTVGVKKVNVRSGSSINYNIVTTLSLGDAVEPRGEFQDWLKIAPPEGTHVWIYRDYVEFLPSGDTAADVSPSETAGPAVEPPVAIEQAAVPAADGATQVVSSLDLPTPIVSPSVPVDDSGATAIPPPPPADLKLIPLSGQGRFTDVSGILRAAPLINEAPSRYRVVRWQDNRWQIICHVYGEASKFRSLQDKRVRITGWEYWIQKAAAPVLVPDQIQELHDSGR